MAESEEDVRRHLNDLNRRDAAERRRTNQIERELDKIKLLVGEHKYSLADKKLDAFLQQSDVPEWPRRSAEDLRPKIRNGLAEDAYNKAYNANARSRQILLYQKVVEKYPDTTWAEKARNEIEFLERL